MDPEVFTHNHSPGFENSAERRRAGDIFQHAARQGGTDVSTSFIQARLRYGAEEWEFARAVFSKRKTTMTSRLLWNDGGTIIFLAAGGICRIGFHSRWRPRPTTARHGRFRFRNSASQRNCSRRSPSPARFVAGMARSILRWTATARTAFSGAAPMMAFTGSKWTDAPADAIR